MSRCYPRNHRVAPSPLKRSPLGLKSRKEPDINAEQEITSCILHTNDKSLAVYQLNRAAGIFQTPDIGHRTKTSKQTLSLENCRAD